MTERSCVGDIVGTGVEDYYLRGMCGTCDKDVGLCVLCCKPYHTGYNVRVAML